MTSSMHRRLRALESAGKIKEATADLSLLTAEERDFLCDLAERDLEYLEGEGEPTGPEQLARAAAIGARISVPASFGLVKWRAKGAAR
jgi:hypothetical protein